MHTLILVSKLYLNISLDVLYFIKNWKYIFLNEQLTSSILLTKRDITTKCHAFCFATV